MTVSPFRVCGALALLSALMLTACKSREEKPPPVAGPAAEVVSGLSADQAHQLVVELAGRLGLELRRASRAIEDQSDVRAVKRTAVGWKIVTVGYIEQASYLSDPRVALIDVWVLTLQMQEYFANGGGREAFGEQTQIALTACEHMVGEAQDVARVIIKPEAFESASRAASDFAREHPMAAAFTRESTRAFSIAPGSRDPIGTVFDTALVPLRAIGGMDETAASIHHAALVVAEAVHVATQLPERLHWQMELLTYELEGTETLTSARDAMGSLSQSSESLAATARDLPGKLREEITRTIAEVDAKQANLQLTLRETQAALEVGDRTVVNARVTLDSVAKASVALEATLREFRGLMSDFEPEKDAQASAVPTEPARPFDINEYTRAAEGIAKASAELNAALISARSLATPGDGQPAALDVVNANVRATANHIAWLVAGTVAAVLGLLLAYRVLSRRIGRDAATT